MDEDLAERVAADAPSIRFLQCLTGDTLAVVKTVTVRELRNDGGAVLDRVARGEELIVTRDGVEVAELRPRRRPAPAPADLIERRRHLPKVDPEGLRRDLDAVLNSAV
jgi:prevent-host-death family protein